LTSVYTIVHQLNGHIGVESEPGKGTRFTIELPRSNEQTTRTAAPIEDGTDLDPGLLGQILLVDDNPQVREVVEMMLQGNCKSLLSVETGDDALACLRANSGLDLLITDVLMPGMDGHQLLRQVREDGLTLPAVLISGFSPEIQCDEDRLQPFWRLAKPFTREQLLHLLHGVQTRSGEEC
jgi:two-component system cell cycle sensor histidine kinase/response regulator CckA